MVIFQVFFPFLIDRRNVHCFKTWWKQGRFYWNVILTLVYKKVCYAFIPSRRICIFAWCSHDRSHGKFSEDFNQGNSFTWNLSEIKPLITPCLGMGRLFWTIIHYHIEEQSRFEHLLDSSFYKLFRKRILEFIRYHPNSIFNFPNF